MHLTWVLLNPNPNHNNNPNALGDAFGGALSVWEHGLIFNYALGGALMSVCDHSL